MAYYCRSLVPHISQWHKVEASSREEAVCNFHYDHGLESLKVTVEEKPEQRYSVAFVLVEVADHLDGEDILLGRRRIRRLEGLNDGHVEELVSRVFHTGIYRRGGVKPAGWKSTKDRLIEVAKLLGWTHDPQDLIAEGWNLEETWDEARARKWGHPAKSS